MSNEGWEILLNLQLIKRKIKVDISKRKIEAVLQLKDIRKIYVS